MAEAQKVYVTLLFNKYRGSLHRYLTRLVACPEDAAELVQESYFRLLRQRNMVQLEALARSYLFQTATNLARDHRRRRLVRLVDRHVALDEGLPASDEFAAERSVAWSQAISAAREGLKELPRLTRHAFVLRRFRGLPYSEIAARLGVSTRTVERKIAEAVDHLRVRIGDAL